MKKYLLTLLLCCGCTSHFAALTGSKQTSDVVLEEMRVELGDIKHTLHAQQVEMRLLEERIEQGGGAKIDNFQDELALIERKLVTIEKGQERLTAEFQKLTAHANQTNASLTQYRDQIVELDRRLEEVLRLKSAITSLTKAVGQKPLASKKYQVKSGDTLERIARRHNTSVQRIKELNQLPSDKIALGQDIVVPDE